ncbi:MAG: GNAT family N-acetyltransferase [Cyanobacteria bacterium P01_E01_bin.34]
MRQQYRQFLIRDWEPRDRQAAASLIGSVLAEYGLGWQPETTDRDVVDVESFYHATGGEFWVVETDNRVVGTAAYYPINRGDNAVELRKMYLLPEARGQGLGRYLLSVAEAEIAAKNFSEVWLETATVLKEACQLYERNGYNPPKSNVGPDVQRCDRVYVKYLNTQSEN